MSHMRLIHRAGSCSHGPCPNVFDIDGDPSLAAVQGSRITDAETLAQLPGLPAHEALVVVPKELLIEYARKLADGRLPA